MRLRAALRLAASSARANLLPGLLLQAVMAVFLAAYFFHEGTKRFLEEVARIKAESGYAFAFVLYVMAAAVLPEVLRVVFFQGGRPDRCNLRSLMVAVPGWGAMGMLVDFFYRCQAVWFGNGSDLRTVLTKVIVDQFLFSPFVSNPLIIGWFTLCAQGFRLAGWREIFGFNFYVERIFPVQVAGWCVWIPGVAVVYFMPSGLQVPVAALLQCFWVLVLTAIRQRGAAIDGGQGRRRRE